MEPKVLLLQLLILSMRVVDLSLHITLVVRALLEDGLFRHEVSLEFLHLVLALPNLSLHSCNLVSDCVCATHSHSSCLFMHELELIFKFHSLTVVNLKLGTHVTGFLLVLLGHFGAC